MSKLKKCLMNFVVSFSFPKCDVLSCVLFQVLTRKEMMDSLRAALRVREETDVFYIVYSGSSQKYSGRWLCIDGFVDLNDVMKIWTVSLARAPENGGFPAKGTRLVLVRSLHHHQVNTERERERKRKREHTKKFAWSIFPCPNRVHARRSSTALPAECG